MLDHTFAITIQYIYRHTSLRPSLHEPGMISARVVRPHGACLVKKPVFVFNPGQLAPTRVGIQLKLWQFCTNILFFTDHFCLILFYHGPYFIAWHIVLLEHVNKSPTFKIKHVTVVLIILRLPEATGQEKSLFL